MKKYKKLKFFCFKKKWIFVAIISVCLILFGCFLPRAIASTTPKSKYTIVVDAGHGGIDGGAIGKTSGISESVLNLNYANCLKEYLQDFGFNVVMTRTTENGLYSPLAKNKKKDDMKKRREIVENSNADFVVSIHMNSFSYKSKGAQVFYGAEDVPSQNLANSIQKYFIKYLQDAKQETKVGDYYILNAIKVPSVLVECGYLSNPDEEKLLLNEDYNKEVCYSILLGILSFLN